MKHRVLGVLWLVLFCFIFTSCAGEPRLQKGIIPRETAAGEPLEEKPVLLLDLPLGPTYTTPGVDPGGVSRDGKCPTSLAVGPDGSIYIVDAARNKVLVYDQNPLTGVIELPFIDQEAWDLMVIGDRLFLRDYQFEYLFDHQGLLHQICGLDDSSGFTLHDLPSRRSSETTYRQCPDFNWVFEQVTDGLGNRYSFSNTIIRRVDHSGQEMARGQLPKIMPYSSIADFFITPGGGVYTLSWVYETGNITRALVHRVLSPVSDSAPDIPFLQPYCSLRPSCALQA
ncbi:MAG: hypothetical protein ACOY9Y_07620 [Bacillota bacterium]